MSWDAYLIDDRGHVEHEVNYTHNTNRMIAAAMEIAGEQPVAMTKGPLGPAIGPAWFDVLDGMSGPEGARLLGGIIKVMEADPAFFLDMDPPNGWGSYDSLLPILREMCQAVPEWPTTWRVHG